MQSHIAINTYDTAHIIAWERAQQFNHPDLFKANIIVEFEATTPGVLQIIAANVGRPLTSSLPVDDKNTILEFDGFLVQCQVHSYTQPFETRKRLVSVIMWGQPDRVERLYGSLVKYKPEKSAKVDWYFRSADGKHRSVTVDLKRHHPPKDEFFPWIENGIAQFQRDFMDSEANILMLIGEPGCGKTTFIRDMIFRHNLSVAITHDEHLMGDDEFFITFLTGNYDALVLEDADRLLKDRSSGNFLMSKLLNASDGLISTKKKMIFTANVTHHDQIDPALIRPGRCFSLTTFREFTLPEATVAANAAGVEPPTKPCSLAAMFGDTPARAPKRFGFG